MWPLGLVLGPLLSGVLVVGVFMAVVAVPAWILREVLGLGPVADWVADLLGFFAATTPRHSSPAHRAGWVRSSRTV